MAALPSAACRLEQTEPKTPKNMPCRDERDHLPGEEDNINHQIMTRLSCDRCREIEARGGTVPDWAKGWWDEHKKADASRIVREQEAKRASEVRQRAIDKLTPEERAELGV